MAAPSSIDLNDLVHEEQRSAEQIVASALQLYAAIPGPARTAAVDALRATAPAAHPALAREVVRAIVAFRLQGRRVAIVREANAGEEPALEPFDLAEDDAMGAEAVALIKASREHRAGADR